MVDQSVVSQKLINEGLSPLSTPLHNYFGLRGQLRNKEDRSKIFPHMEEAELDHGHLFERTRDFTLGLTKRWNWKMFWWVPGTAIRNYFGEKIAMYFEFLSHYTIYLVWPGLIGLVMFILDFIFDADSEERRYSQFAFGLVLIIWSTVVYETWSRKQNTFSLKWGQLDFEEEETPRAAFKGVAMRNPITDEKMQFQQPWLSLFKFAVSFCVSAALLLLELGIVAFLLFLRGILHDAWEGEWYEFLAIQIPVQLNTIVILVFNRIYGNVAYWLTNFENHRTNTAYERSLIMKTFLFSAISSYNILFYIAFAKRYQLGCITTVDGNSVLSEDVTCTSEIQNQLRSIFIIAIFKNAIEIGLPFIMNFLRKRSKKRLYSIDENDSEQAKLLIRIEQQMDLNAYAYKEIDGTYYDYLEIMLQIGYIMLFGVAFQAAPLLALINNIVEIWIDRGKLCYFTKRPLPMGAESIGIWMVIFNGICYLGIFTSWGVIHITDEAFSDSTSDQFFWFVTFSVVSIGVKIFLKIVIPDIPKPVKVAATRHAYISKKVLDGMPLEIEEKTDKERIMYHTFNRKDLEESENVTVDDWDDRAAPVMKSTSKKLDDMRKEKQKLLSTVRMDQLGLYSMGRHREDELSREGNLIYSEYKGSDYESGEKFINDGSGETDPEENL